MNFIKRHKGVLIVCIICLVLMVLAIGAVYRIFNPNSEKTVYGDRLEGAPNIDSSIIEEIKTEITDTKLIEQIKYETNVVVVKFYIDVKSDTTMKKAQSLTEIIIEKLGNEVLDFYDIEVYLTKKTGEDESFPAIGYHSKNAEKFSFTINKAGDTNE